MMPPEYDRFEIAKGWLPRYTGMPLAEFGKYILLTNFNDYVDQFAERFNCKIYGQSRPMQAATNDDGLTIVNFGIGSPNAATIMDLLSAIDPKGVLFLGKCGGLKDTTEIGNFILPKERAWITCRRKFPRCRRLNCTNLSPIDYLNVDSNTVLASSTRPTGACGSMTMPFGKNSAA